MITDSIKGFLGDKFNLYLTLALLVLGTVLLLSPTEAPIPSETGNTTVTFFYTPTCPYCSAQKPILGELENEFPDVAFIHLDASTPAGIQRFRELAMEAGMDLSRLGVPTTFVGTKPLVGLQSKEALTAEIEHCIEICLNGPVVEEGGFQEAEEGLTEFDLPFLGRTDLTSLSLPVLAIVLGLIDGFNPCAMWVLVYLIALLMNITNKEDRTKKIIIIVGSFVFASGVLYFLFMTAWLNAFLFMGYVYAVTVAIGLVALGGGILSIRDYLQTKGALECKVTDAQSKTKTMKKIDHLVSQPVTWGMIIAIIALAFVVNSVEFVCSAAIPAVFTQILVISDLPMLDYYLYIGLYVLFFMLDNLLIFGLAVFAVNTTFGEKYAKYCKVVGGVILVGLGIMLLFAPELLR